MYCSAAVSRKSEFSHLGCTSQPSLAGTPLTRKQSLRKIRPFLHQYEVKGHPYKPNSAPSSPVRVKGSSFKRSLSFGGGVNPRCVATSGMSAVDGSQDTSIGNGGPVRPSAISKSKFFMFIKL